MLARWILKIKGNKSGSQGLVGSVPKIPAPGLHALYNPPHFCVNRNCDFDEISLQWFGSFMTKVKRLCRGSQSSHQLTLK